MSTKDRMETVGFVGMGVMGSGMAANVLKRGFPVAGYDIDPKRNEQMAKLGAVILDGPAAVARAAAKTVCMVETTAQAESVIVGKACSCNGSPAWKWKSSPRNMQT